MQRNVYKKVSGFVGACEYLISAVLCVITAFGPLEGKGIGLPRESNTNHGLLLGKVEITGRSTQLWGYLARGVFEGHGGELDVRIRQPLI